jgi:hypothetical protein
MAVCSLNGSPAKTAQRLRRSSTLAHLIEEIRVRVVVLPAAGFPERDEVPLPTLNQREPFMCRLSYGLPCRSDMQRARGAVESALPDNQRAVLIRATKMNVPPQGLFVDFLFIDICGQIDSMGVRARPAIALVPAKAGCRSGFPLARE